MPSSIDNRGSIKINPQTHKKLKLIAQKEGITVNDLIILLTNFLTKNPSLILDLKSGSSLKFETDVVTEFMKRNNRFMRAEINRLIGFIKVQDEFMSKMKNDIMFKLDKEDNPEYHPLFDDYDRMIKYIFKVLEKRNITENTIKDDIEKILGKDKLKSFLESETRTTRKTIKI